jgi:prepilin-type N-terminal cleavage/methylation domain-containing protein
MSTMHRRAHDRGFSLVELLVVVVIIGVLAALSAPMFGKNRRSAEGKVYAGEIAREFQRARMRAVSERMSMYAFVYSNRVEIRSSVAGATEGAAATAPTTASPILTRVVISASSGVSIYKVVTTPATPLQTLGTSGTNYALIIFTTMGGVQVIPMSGVLTVDVPVYVYLRNNDLNAANQERDYRIDLAALTGFVQVRNVW